MSKAKGQGSGCQGDQPKAPTKRTCVIDPLCFEDLQDWAKTDAKILPRVFDLMTSALKDPFGGLGKPEPLKYLGSNTWSRRITQEHRLIYVVFGDRVHFVQARKHY